jgi:predicted nucleotide-binding protein
MDDSEFGVFISHGGKSTLWKDLARFIEKELEMNTFELSEQSNHGKSVIEKLEKTICEDCDYAIILMTAEDTMNDGTKRTRQNVIHEIGFCQGVLGRKHVLLLKQKGIELFSNIHGLVYEEFDGENITSVFHKVRKHLEEAFEAWDDDDYEYGVCD